MKLKQQLILIILLAFSNVNAQYTLTGFVKDKSNNESLVSATVFLPDLKMGTVANENGTFAISNLKEGNYILKISLLGYQSVVYNVYVKSDTSVFFFLEPSATELNEIIITGVARVSELKRNPIIVKTISSNTLKQGSATNIIDALTSTAGVNSISSGPNISKPVIRGLGYNRVITLNNGIKQEGQQWGDEHGIEIDEYSVDRIEIIKGPGSLLYGSDGIAGVLNFLPPKFPLNKEIKTQFISNYQSNNNLFGYSISNSGNMRGIQWISRFSNKYAGNYQNKYDGKVLNSGFNEFNGNLSLGINKKWGHSTLNLSSYNTKLGIIEGARDSLGNFIYENENGEINSATSQDLKGYDIQTPYQKINHQSLIYSSYFILKKSTVNLDLAFQNNKRREFEEANEPDEEGLSLSLNTFNYNLRWNLDKFRGWETSIGLGGMKQSNTNKGEEFLIPDYQLFDAGIFAFAQKNYKKLTLAGGMRFDNRWIKTQELYLDSNENPIAIPDNNSELKFSSLNKNYFGIAGSIGASYQASKKSTLKFNLSRGFRSPNIAELSSNGKHEGSFRYEIGNHNLNSEISHQIDFAYYYTSEHITLELSPFLNLISNYSFLEKLKNHLGADSIPNPMDLSPAFKYTATDAQLYGGEIYIDWHPHPLDWMHIENSFSFVNASLNLKTDSTQYLPFIPAPHYRGGVKIEFNKVSKHISNMYLKFYLDHYFEQNRIYKAYETETPTDGYSLLNLGLGMNFRGKGSEDLIKIYFNVNNLSNIAYQNHLSKLKYTEINSATGRKGVFNMGRNFSVKMIIEI